MPPPPPALRPLPAALFLVVCALLCGAEYANRSLPALGLAGAIAARALGGPLRTLLPGFSDPRQRLAGLVGMIAAVFFYGGVLGPAVFPHSRSFAFLVGTLVRGARFLPMPREEALDAGLRAAAWVGLVATACATSTTVFPWVLLSEEEREAAAAAPARADDKKAR